MCLHKLRIIVTWRVIAVRKSAFKVFILTFALLVWSKSCKIEDYVAWSKLAVSSSFPSFWPFLIWIGLPAYLTTSVLKPEPNLLSGWRLYKWEEKSHCSSIIWHDIIWRPPKTDFWVNSWKYFVTGTIFLAEIRLHGWLGIFWLKTFLERRCAADFGKSLFLAEIKSRD